MSLKFKTLLCTCGFMMGTLGIPQSETGASAHEADTPRCDIPENLNKIEVPDSQTVNYTVYVDLNINTHAVAQNYNVIYTTAGGAQTLRQGGSRAWRNNNPGCIRSGSFAHANGAIGSAGGFAVFPDEQTGMDAICALLRSEKYRNKTIGNAMYSYAPPFENNTAAYNSYLRRLTGMSTTLKLSDLTDEQIRTLARAIRQVEGWQEGTIRQIRADTVNKAIMQNKMQKTL